MVEQTDDPVILLRLANALARVSDSIVRALVAHHKLARAEGILPAPEPTHAIRVAIDEALAAKEAGEARVILFNLCGHGHFDMQAYDDYLNDRLPQVEFDPEQEAAALARVPNVPID